MAHRGWLAQAGLTRRAVRCAWSGSGLPGALGRVHCCTVRSCHSRL